MKQRLPKRLLPLDILRGIAIAYVIFIHGASYNFADFGKLKINELPLALIIIGLIGLWGGIFAIYSLLANVLMTLQRDGQKRLRFQTIGYVVLTGLALMLVIGTIQTLLLGRWSIDAHNLQLSVVAELMRGESLVLHFDKLLTGSGIRTIGLNLVVVPLVIYLVLRKQGLRDHRDTYQLLFGLGLIILTMSFVRVWLYDWWRVAVGEGNYVAGLAGSFLLADPYPGIAYLAYGFIGAGLAAVLFYQRLDIVKHYVLPMALILVAIGTAGVSLHQPNMFGASWFWYFKVILETGLFVLFFLIAIWLIVKGRNLPAANTRFLGRLYRSIAALSRISLTAYMFETLTSELLRYVWFWINEDWQTSVTACLLIGLTNLLVWVAIALLWQKSNFRYSVEYWWVRLFEIFGKKSTKLADSPI